MINSNKHFYNFQYPKEIRKILFIFNYLFWIVNFIIYLFLTQAYLGNQIILFVYFFVTNYYFIICCNKKIFFFEKILSFFIWISFWLKFSLSLIIFNHFSEIGKYFDNSKYLFDKGLLVSIIAILNLTLLSVLINKKIKTNYNLHTNKKNTIFVDFYFRNIKKILFLFVLIFAVLSFLNINFFIYRRGFLVNENLNYIVLNLFKWLTIFGLSSFSTLIIFCHLKKNKNLFLGLFLSILEGFFTNIGLLSRAMIFQQFTNFLSLVRLKYGVLNKKVNYFFIIKYLFFIFLIFYISNFIINYERKSLFSKYSLENEISIKNTDEKEITKNEKYVNAFIFLNKEFVWIALNRWVGIDAVLSVVSHPNLNENILINALKEKFDDKNYSYYERIFYNHEDDQFKTEIKGNYGIILPGFIAFSLYSGSLIVMFLIISSLYFFGILLEMMALKLSYGNLLFSALIGNVYAFRLIHFGYIPSQTYLLIAAIILNILLYNFYINFIYFYNKK
jgi:hypothetical protein